MCRWLLSDRRWSGFRFIYWAFLHSIVVVVESVPDAEPTVGEIVVVGTNAPRRQSDRRVW